MSTRRKKRNIRLPNKILALPNVDKTFHEKWYKGRNMLNVPHPFRAVCLGPPNCGKGTVVKNVLMRAKPPFQEVYCIHCDPEYTKEWDDCDAQMMSQIPPPEEWKGEVKTLVIIDDLDLKGLSKVQTKNLSRLYGFVATHKNVSVILCSQDAFNVPPIVRRCSNLWIMWKINDLDAMSAVSRKSGMSSSNFNSIFNQLMMDQHDSLWIDCTNKSPYPLRKNGYTLITKKDGEKATKILEGLDKFTAE